ncbi:hypothetical protein B4U80_05906, partial [Leptotrombidium deliense]
MDNENLQRTDRLKYKVSQLKSFAIDIETETKEHNTLLDSIDGDFGGVNGFIHGSRNRVNRLLVSGKNNRRGLVSQNDNIDRLALKLNCCLNITNDGFYNNKDDE